MTEAIKIEEAKQLLKLAKANVKDGKYLEALDLCDEIIVGLALMKSYSAKLLVGGAMRILGTVLGLQNMERQKKGDLKPAEIENIWKPAFSCLWSAIAYQNANRDEAGLAGSWAQIIIFRLAKGETLDNVAPEIQAVLGFIKKAKTAGQYKEDATELLRIENILCSLGPAKAGLQGINIEVMMTA